MNAVFSPAALDDLGGGGAERTGTGRLVFFGEAIVVAVLVSLFVFSFTSLPAFFSSSFFFCLSFLAVEIFQQLKTTSGFSYILI